MASAIVQVYLKHVLELFFSADIEVRSVALDVVTTILHQGLINPAQVSTSNSNTANLRLIMVTIYMSPGYTLEK